MIAPALTPRPMSTRWDVFCLYEVLAGCPPFVAEGAGQILILDMHLFQAPPPLLSFAPNAPKRTQHHRTGLRFFSDVTATGRDG